MPQSGMMLLLGGASVVAYLAYEYKEKLQLSRKFKAAMEDMRSSDVETQTVGVESVVAYIVNNKSLIKELCENTDVVRELPQIIFSEDEDCQFSALELLSIISQDEHGLDAIRHCNILPSLIAVLSSPNLADDVLQNAMLTLKHCTAPLHKTIFHPSTGQPVKVPVDRASRSGNDEYDREEEWFARELYQQHGLEPIINKLLSENNDIQTLALEILINHCKTLKNQDEIGELGAARFMLEIFTSTNSSPSLKSLSLLALRQCIQSHACTVDQFRKSGAIKVIVTYFKNEAPKTIQGSDKQDDIFNALKILNFAIDAPGIELMRAEQIIPQFVGYFMQENNQDIKNTTVAFLKQLAHMDPKARKEISDAFKRENLLGNAGVPPSAR